MTTRIYKVQTPKGPRLVRANHPSKAVGHVARDMITADVATQDDLVRLLGAGAQVEVCGKASDGQPVMATLPGTDPT